MRRCYDELKEQAEKLGYEHVESVAPDWEIITEEIRFHHSELDQVALIRYSDDNAVFGYGIYEIGREERPTIRKCKMSRATRSREYASDELLEMIREDVQVIKDG